VDPGMGQVPPIVSYMIMECWKPEAERPLFDTLLQLLRPMQVAVEGEGAPGLASVPVPSATSAATKPEPEPELEEGVPPQLRAPPDLNGDGFANVASRPGVQLRAPPPLEPASPPASSPQHPIHYAVDEVHYIAETVDEFIELLTEASVDEQTLVWQEGMEDWEAVPGSAEGAGTAVRRQHGGSVGRFRVPFAASSCCCSLGDGGSVDCGRWRRELRLLRRRLCRGR
jgi:hypothetical protein